MKLAIFDFDGTLFPKQTIPYLMKCYLELGYSKRRAALCTMKVMKIFVKYKLPIDKGYGKEQFRQQATIHFIQLFNGKNPKEVETFFAQAVPKVVEQLNPMVVDEVRRAKERGEQCVLLSGCFDGVLEGVGKALGMDMVIGTDIITGKVKQGKLAIDTLDIATGPKKVERLMEQVDGMSIDWENSKAYGDSDYDKYILNLVGQPIAVNPDDLLRGLALEKGWTILEGE